MSTSTITPAQEFSARAKLIPVELLYPSPFNPRKTYDPKETQELAASIEKQGVIEPLIVRPRGSKEGFEVVAGSRRLKAIELLGRIKMANAPCVVGEYTDAQVLEIQLVENLQRAGVHPMEEAHGYARLLEVRSQAKPVPGTCRVCRCTVDKPCTIPGGLPCAWADPTRTLCNNPACIAAAGDTSEAGKVKQIARSVGKSASYIYQRLKLLELQGKPREEFSAGHVSLSHAILLARLKPEQQDKALEQCLGLTHVDLAGERSPVSVRALQKWIDSNLYIPLASAPFRLDDPKLLPQAGACTTCPKNTAAQPDLFSDHQGAPTCTDPECFHKKRQRFIQIRGQELYNLENTKPVFLSQQMHRDATLPASYVPMSLWGGREVKKGACPFSKPAVIADGPQAGQVRHVCLDKNCPKHGEGHSGQQKPTPRAGAGTSTREKVQKAARADRKREQQKREREKAERAAGNRAVFLAALRSPKMSGRPFADLVIRELISGDAFINPDVQAMVGAFFGWKVVSNSLGALETEYAKRAGKMSPEQLAKLMAALVLAGDAGPHDFGVLLDRKAGAFVNVKKVRAQAIAELKEEGAKEVAKLAHAIHSGKATVVVHRGQEKIVQKALRVPKGKLRTWGPKKPKATARRKPKPRKQVTRKKRKK